MLGRTVFAATLLALAQFAIASPPSCLLGAASQYSDPSDIKSACKDKDLSAKIAKICGDDTQAAMQALADICNGQNVKIAADVASPTGSTPTTTGSSEKSTSAVEKPTGTAGTTMNSLYPTASGGSSSHGSSGRNGTAPVATGGPKSPPSPTGPASVPGGNHHNDAGKLEFGFAALVAGLMVVAL